MAYTKLTRLIAWSEIIGGIAGLALLPLVFFQQQRFIPHELRVSAIWYVAGLVAFGTTITAGVLLQRGRPAGRTASIVIQALQVPQVAAAGLVYQFSTGIEILGFVSSTEVRFSPGVRAAFNAMPMKVAQPWSVAVNLFAVAALVVLLRSDGPTASQSAAEHAA